MKYTLCEVINESYAFIEELSTDEVRQLDNFHEQLFELRLYSVRQKAIELNIRDFIGKTEKYLQDYKSTTPANLEEFHLILTDINRLFTNILASIDSYIESIRKRLERKYTKNSEEFKRFKLFLENLKAKHFSYRFFYCLRNYSLHFDLPLQDFRFNVGKKPNNQVDNMFIINFSKQRLLLDPLIKKNLAVDLRGYNDTFPIMPLLIDFQFRIEEIAEEIFKIEYPKCIEAVEYLESYVQKSTYKKEILYGGDSDGKQVKYRVFGIDLIRKFYELKTKYIH
jgi:hypothetical protein